MQINEVIKFKSGQVEITFPPMSCLKIAAGLNRAAVVDDVHADEMEALSGMFYAAGRAAYEQTTVVSAGNRVAIERDWGALLAEAGLERGTGAEEKGSGGEGAH